MSAYEHARAQYAAAGVNADAAIERLRRVPPEGLCRVKGPQGLFLGLGRVEPEAGQLRFVKSFLEQEGTP